MRIKLYGVRGSLPSGLVADSVESKIENALRLFVSRGHSRLEEITPFLNSLPFYQKGTYGPSTPCVEVSSEQGSVLFDSGSGIRVYGVNNFRTQDEFHIFQTHFHWDHTCGLPFFVPIFIPNKVLHFYGVHKNLQKHIETLFSDPYFPVSYKDLPSIHHFHQLNKYEPVQLYGMKITAFELDHPNTAYGYHIECNGKRLALCFDTEFKRMSRQDLGDDLPYYQNADMVLFDGQYTISEVLQKIDWGHCTAKVGVDLCLRENIKTMVIMSHDPNSDDQKIYRMSSDVKAYYELHYEEMKREEPDISPLEILVGYEGMELEL